MRARHRQHKYNENSLQTEGKPIICGLPSVNTRLKTLESSKKLSSRPLVVPASYIPSFSSMFLFPQLLS